VYTMCETLDWLINRIWPQTTEACNSCRREQAQLYARR